MDFELNPENCLINDNPYSCVVCRKAFARKVGIRTHIRKTKHSITKKWPNFLKTVLPQQWPYTVISFSRSGSQYKLKSLLPNVVTVAELRKWIETYLELNKCVYTRVGRKKNRSGLTPYSEFYRCQHFHPKKDGKKRSKGTGCKSTITASLKCDYSSSPYYTTVCINFTHNHPVHSGETLKFRKPSALVEEVFHRMFEDGLSPAQALKNFMIHLEFQPADLYLTSISDRTKCPDYNWVHYFHSKLFKKNSKFLNCTESMANLIRYAGQLNAEHGPNTCLCQKIDDTHFIMSIVTPLMRRALVSKVSGEIIYIDSVGSVDKFGIKIYLLFTEYNVTRIPVGVIIVTHESQAVIEKGFKLFLKMISSDPLTAGGLGQDGPVVIMIDQWKTETKVLKTVFPKATLLLYSFYLLRNVYKWLLNSKYHVSKDDLSQLYTSIRKLVYSNEKKTLEYNFTSILKTYTDNPLLISYVRHLYDKRNKWASCYKFSFLRKDVDRNIVAEREIQILKERILERIKVQTPILLVNYFFVDFEEFYKKKLINSCVELHHNFFSHELSSNVNAKNYTFGTYFNSENLYYVFNKSKKTKYIVNLDVGLCTCCVGVSGNACKHQQIVIDDINDEPQLQYTMIIEPNLDLYYMATGSTELTQSFFDSIQTTNVEDMEAKMEEENEEVIDNDIEENLDNHIVEEILIEVKDADELNEGAELVAKLKDCFREFVGTLRGNAQHYREGIIAMSRELEKLCNSSAACKLAAMDSFRSNVS